MSKHELQKLGAFLETKKPTLQQIAPQGTDVNRIVSLALFEAAKNDQLLKCSPESVYIALSKACELNLVAGGVLHRAHLVPIWNGKKRAFGAELWIDYTGLMDLVRRSGEIANFVARVVHENEEFEHYFDLEQGEVLKHRPSYDGDPGALKLAYAVCYFKDGQKQVEVMRRDQIEKIRASARSGNSGPWVSHTEEMWRKTVIRRICKYLPLSGDARAALEHDTSTDITGQGADIFVPQVVLDDLNGSTPVMLEAAPIEADESPAPKKRRKKKSAKAVDKAMEELEAGPVSLSSAELAEAEADFVTDSSI